MSLDEYLVIGFGLFIGYWVVAKLILGERRPAQAAPVDGARPPAADAPAGDAPWYEVLQVSPQAGIEEIHRAYQLLISQYHPDKVAALGEELRALAARKSAQINAAYQQAQRERGAAR